MNERHKMNLAGIKIDLPRELDLEAGAPFEGRGQPATMRIPQDIQELFGPLVEMATNAWRLKVRMVDRETGEPNDEMRKLYRFVEGLFRALADAGIQVVDKTGKPYDNGMSEKVITFEQTPGLAKEEIIDTVRPAIRWKERLLYHGEIIVGIPVVKASPKEAPKAEASSAPSDAAAGRAQEAGTEETPAPPPDELSGPERNESLCLPEPDVVRSGGRTVLEQGSTGSARRKTAIPEDPSEQERAGGDAEDESASANPGNTQERPVDPKTTHSESPEQGEERQT
jgi:hypothetical protein